MNGADPQLLVALLLLGAGGACCARRALLLGGSRRLPAGLLLLFPVLSMLSCVSPWHWSIGLSVGTVTAATQPLPAWLVPLWSSVALLLLLRTLYATWAAARWLQELPEFDDVGVQRVFADSCQHLGFANVALRQGTLAAASSLSGQHVVLPASARRWPSGCLRAVLCHELTHLQRRDDLLLLASRLITDLFWWVPGVGSIRDSLADAVEHGCDQQAWRRLGNRMAYASGLVRAARDLREHGGSTAFRSSPLVALLGRCGFAARVQRLTAPPGPMLRVGHGSGAVLMLGAALLLLVTAQPVTERPVDGGTAVDPGVLEVVGTAGLLPVRASPPVLDLNGRATGAVEPARLLVQLSPVR